jgi:hypothetical protein
MSTHHTLAYGDDFSFYVDMFEDGKVYLELRGAEFVARPGGVTVAIPLALWERLRTIETVPSDWWDWPGEPKEPKPGGETT